MKLIPDILSSSASPAETKIFKALKQLDDYGDWYCLHSLGLARHSTKREGEIDFLLVGPIGIFALEVKGGRLTVQDGVWSITDRYSRVNRNIESPFIQAKSALYSLKSDLSSHFGSEISSALFGYGVVFPDIDFDVESVEWDAAIVYDQRSAAEPIVRYLSRLFSYWASRQHHSKPIAPADLRSILLYLRPNFEGVQPLQSALSASEEQIVALTLEQCACLYGLELNPRTIFTGPAGTGKTILACEKARRLKSTKSRTLFLCFNKMLAQHVQDALAGCPGEGDVEVFSLHSLFKRVIDSGNYSKKLAGEIKKGSTPSLFEDVFTDLFTKTWDVNNAYDNLIIDEAQDIISENYIGALNLLVKGGFEYGKWSLFLDPENQSDVFGNLAQAQLDRISAYATSYRLTVNCRNTRPIAVQTEAITDIKIAQTLRIDGLPVKFLWYEDDADQGFMVSAAINELLTNGASVSDITILSPKRFAASLAGTGRIRSKYKMRDLTANFAAGVDTLACASVAAFKGLDSPIVVMTDISDITGPRNTVLNYVGLTRARSLLVVALHNGLRSNYLSHIERLIEYPHETMI